jgi:hypothetical protein
LVANLLQHEVVAVEGAVEPKTDADAAPDEEFRAWTGRQEAGEPSRRNACW